MDGNGRWAEARGRPRIDGHRAGAKAVQATVEAAVRCGLEVLTLYSFSTENWTRTKNQTKERTIDTRPKSTAQHSEQHSASTPADSLSHVRNLDFT